MKLQMSRETYKARWVKYEDCELFLRPYPIGRNDFIMSVDQSLTVPGEQRKSIFMYSVENWRKIVDSNDKELKCTKETKERVFDYNLGGIAGFVYSWNVGFESIIKGELEHLQHGQDGSSAKEVHLAENVE